MAKGALRQRIAGFLRERTGPSLTLLWTSRQPLVWLLALATGIAGAYGILAFRYGIGLVQWLWLGNRNENVVATLAGLKAPWILFLALVGGGLVVGLMVQFVTPARRAEGIADVMEARALRASVLPLRNGLASAVVSVISLGCGASAGREGPAVHLGASIAAALTGYFRLPPAARRVLLGCGAAAAVSASFNAPIAGVLFAHEVILGHYALSAFVPTVIAAVAATLITRFQLGDFPAFIIASYHIVSYWEFFAFALLGIVSGLVAVAFQTSLMAADWAQRQVSLPIWVRPAIGGALVAAIALAVPEVLGVGYEATNLALKEKYALVWLLVMLVAKIAATAITLASRFGGGVFSPSLYLGAMTGGAFGIIAAAALPAYASGYGVYAMVGMGAVAGAILGAPISSALIVFELTGGYAITIALLLAVSIATMINQALVGHSFFEWQLSLRGLFLTDGPHRRVVREFTVADFMTALSPEEKANPPDLFDRPRLSPADTLEAALRLFAGGSFTRLAVMDSSNSHIAWADYVAALKVYNQALIDANVEEHR
jgi:CIC family chloride channel protein